MTAQVASAESAMARSQLQNLEAEKAVLGVTSRQQRDRVAEELEQVAVDERADHSAAVTGVSPPVRAGSSDIAALASVEAATAADETRAVSARAQLVRTTAEVVRALTKDEREARAVLKRVAKLVAAQGAHGTVTPVQHALDDTQLQRLQRALHYRRDLGLLHSEATLLRLIQQTQHFETRLMAQEVQGEFRQSHGSVSPLQGEARLSALEAQQPGTWLRCRQTTAAEAQTSCSAAAVGSMVGATSGHGVCVDGFCKCAAGFTYSSHDNRCWDEKHREAGVPRPTPRPMRSAVPRSDELRRAQSAAREAESKHFSGLSPPSPPLPSKPVRCAGGSFPIATAGGGAVCGVPREHCRVGTFYPVWRRRGRTPGGSLAPSPCVPCPAGKTSTPSRLSCRWLRRDESPRATKKRLRAMNMRGSGASANVAEGAPQASSSSDTTLDLMLLLGCITLAVSTLTLGVGSGMGLPFKVRQMLANRPSLGAVAPLPGDTQLAERKTLLDAEGAARGDETTGSTRMQSGQQAPPPAEPELL